MRLPNFGSTNDVGSVSIDRENCLHVQILTRVRLFAGLEHNVLNCFGGFQDFTWILVKPPTSGLAAWTWPNFGVQKHSKRDSMTAKCSRAKWPVWVRSCEWSASNGTYISPIEHTFVYHLKTALSLQKFACRSIQKSCQIDGYKFWPPKWA